MSPVTRSINTYLMIRPKHQIGKVWEFGAEGTPSIEMRATTSRSVDSSAYAVGSIATRAADIISGVLRPPSNSLADVQEADWTVNVPLGAVFNIDGCIPSVGGVILLVLGSIPNSADPMVV